MQENSTIIQPAPAGTMLLTFGLDGDMWHELTTVISFVIERDGDDWRLVNVVTTIEGDELYRAEYPCVVPPSIEDPAHPCRALVVGGRVSFMDHEYDSVEDFLASMRNWRGLAHHMLPEGLLPVDRAAWIAKHDCRDLLRELH